MFNTDIFLNANPKIPSNFAARKERPNLKNKTF
jgi:hypothetical protein